MSDTRDTLVETALDPARSVVVSACAGSGKTWLLVGRIFRLLLDGALPSEILAITFTRKAAQEMTARLDRLLESAALADDATLDRLLDERGVRALGPVAQAQLRGRARDLFERVLTAEPPLTLSTFHSWFLQLVQRAPLAAGTLAGSTLAEGNAALFDEALKRLGARAARVPARGRAERMAPGVASAPPGGSGATVPGNDDAGAAGFVPPSLAGALDRLFADCGLDPTLSLLRSFIAHRAEWWAMTSGREDRLQYIIGELREAMPSPLCDDPDFDVLQGAHADALLRRDLLSYRELLGRNSTGRQDLDRAALIDLALQAPDAPAWHAGIRASLYSAGGTGSAFVYKTTKARAARIGAADQEAFLELNEALVARLDGVQAMLREQRCFGFNVATFTCAVALLREFDTVKRQRQAIDFVDLEQHACQLLTDDDHAAYLHARLDARYRHLLLDEFQDTNPLQWIALRAWLDAAQAADAKPTVFLVGDPKQSIYRFRGAEARLFDAARDFLVEHYDAAVLAQDTSRRCAPPVIDLVNVLFDGKPAFAGFRPHLPFDAAKPGRVEVLAMAGLAAPADGCAADAASSTIELPGEGEPLMLRDPLAEARAAPEDLRIEQEGRMLVDGLARLRSRSVLDDSGRSRPVAWRDVLVLVRTRTKLWAYERALREAGIPCTSSRQGGLLDTLELRDMLALLRFLVAPHDDLALAHVLRSPVFSLSDADLAAVATVADDREAQSAVPGAQRPTWQARLCAWAAQAESSAQVKRADELLARWFGLAGTRPVHDLLDAIYFDADVLARYRMSVAPGAASAVEANLLALLEHALAADAGRYPTLARFVDELDDLSRRPPQEAPDEASLAGTDDAVRIMTVHGAKGLEAPIVWLLDCAAPRPALRGNAILVEWPAESKAPAHFSFWTRRDALGNAQSEVSARALQLSDREELNLLYVAVTRARQVLVVSGHEVRGHEKSWYATLRAALLQLRSEQSDPGGSLAYGDTLPGAEAGRMATGPADAAWRNGIESAEGVDAAPVDPRLNLPVAPRTVPGRTQPADLDSALSRAGARYGEAFHALIERLTEPDRRALAARQINPEADEAGPAPAVRMLALGSAGREMLRDTLGVGADDFERLWNQARRVLGSPALARFFDPAQFVRARNEVSYLDSGGRLRRIDRLVEFEDEVWVLDYKTGDSGSLDSRMADYLEQLGDYAAAMCALYPGRQVHAALVLADGSLVPL